MSEKTKHGFEEVNDQEIPEIRTRARLFRHLRTGAELLSLENDDENKCFGVTFRTPPPDSTGLPHIMEHSVLCGSRKYPVKEPFVELMKGSLNTFLNAMTYPDRTCYPVASANLQDFYNLVDVYLDAVFFPLIPPETLQQEGWHYELDSLEVAMAYKGVVFNEMKGVYSSPDSLLQDFSQRSLFPDNAYHLDSGGDPKVIPDLTYAQFKQFHASYYHPSNALIFFYGDDNPEERLRLIDTFLVDFGRIDLPDLVGLQPAFSSPRRADHYYPAGEGQDGDKAMVTTNWLFHQVEDAETRLGLSMLAYILIGTPASPLRKALIDSGLGEDLAGVGLETDVRQWFFSTGLKGIVVDDAGKVEQLILETLGKLVAQGIEPDMVAAALNTIEFRLRENNTGSFPRGLSLMLRSNTTWPYGGDPLAPLAFEAPLAGIQGRLRAGERYFESLIQNHMVANPHRSTILLHPDPELNQREDAAEKERLAKARARMSSAELQAVVENTRLLKQRQETPDSPEALATIPSLKLSDLDLEIKRIPTEKIDLAGAQVLFHDLFTNGIVYLDVGLDLHALPQEYLGYVALFGRALLEMGTQEEDFVKFSQRIGRATGGIRPAALTATVRGAREGAAWLFMRGKATVAQLADLATIYQEMLLGARFDQLERFKQIVLEEKAGQESGLLPAGHRVINSRLRARFGEADWAGEQIGGVSYLLFLRHLAEEIERDWPAVLAKLEHMRGLLVNRNQMLFNVTLDENNWKNVQPQLIPLLESLPTGAVVRANWQPRPFDRLEGLTIPSQVNYVAKGADLYQLGYQLDGSSLVLSNFLNTTWLWEKVRVQGGAYGGFCLFDHRSGVLSYLSYRDPNLMETLNNYDQAGEFLRQLALDRTEITKSIIGAIGELDAYQLPDAKGYTALIRYLVGETDELRQQYRAQVLDTSLDDFHRFGEMLEKGKDAGQVVVLGAVEAIQAANQQLKKEKFNITKVL
jgi:hypothetical protein